MKSIIQAILELSQNHKSAEDWEAEIHEKHAQQLIANYLLQHRLHEQLTWPFELPENVEDYTNDQLRFLIDSVSLTNEDVLELNWQYVSTFWPEDHENKEHFKKLLTEMLEMKDMFYNLEEEDF